MCVFIVILIWEIKLCCFCIQLNKRQSDKDQAQTIHTLMHTVRLCEFRQTPIKIRTIRSDIIWWKANYILGSQVTNDWEKVGVMYQLTCSKIHLYIHPSIYFLYPLNPIHAHEGAWAYPSCHWARGGYILDRMPAISLYSSRKSMMVWFEWNWFSMCSRSLND